MFGKAKIKRFNDETGCAPAPNAYDAKAPTSKRTGFALVTSKRFDSRKEETPGPGQYLAPSDKSIKASPQVLKRSASFRVNSLMKSGSRADLSRNDIFKTPVSTPRRLRRSISTGDVTINQSPHLKKEDVETMNNDSGDKDDENAKLQARISELENQLRDAMDKLVMSEDSVVVKLGHEGVEDQLRSKVEQLEAELETCRVELRLKDEDREKSERLAEQLDNLKIESDYAYTLKSENELLNQDIQTLEEELSKYKEERDKVESELDEMRKVRKDLDAKNVFLHFTQEQLNAQVVSLESVVRNLKTENHLLNKGIRNLVDQVQNEKKKFEELSEQYNSENAEAEEEFKHLEAELEENKAKAKSMEFDLRSKLGEAEVEKVEMMKSIDELKKDFEVSENDKTVLKDQLEFTENSVNEIALDLAAVSKQKEEFQSQIDHHLLKIEQLEKANEVKEDLIKTKSSANDTMSKMNEELTSENDQLKKTNKDLENELKEFEMSKAGLEGVNAALEEEITTLEATNNELKSQSADMEFEKEKLTEEINELKISKQEVEESLLDTQGLVEDMEIKLMEAHGKHRDEASDLAEKLKKTTSALEDVKDERASLLEMNTALSGQVAEALHSIHNLQTRENSLQQELVMVKQFMEAAQVEGEEDRIRMMQTEDELISLQAEMEDVYLRAEVAETEVKNHSIEAASLNNQIEQLMKELDTVKEYNKAQQESLKAAYNTAVAELTESKTVGRQLLEQLGVMEEQLEKKKMENSKILKDFEERNEEALHEMDKMVQGFEQEKILFHENIKHLEDLRDNLEKTVSEKTENLHSQKIELDEVRKKEELALNKIEEVTKTNLRLKGNLELRATENLKLKEVIQVVKKETEEFQAQKKASELKIQKLSDQKAEIDRLRTAELEMCCRLREKLAEAEKKAEVGESAVRSMEAQQIVVMEAEAKLEEERTKAEEYQEVINAYMEKLQEMEALMVKMEERNEDLESQAEEANTELKNLQDMIEPFKEQLEGFEMEKNSLLSSNLASKEEVTKLSTQYSSLLGHQNHAQKIKHVVQLKQENVSLKSKVEALQLELSKANKSISKWEQKYNEAAGLKKFDPRLSFQPTPRNKENFQTPHVKDTRKSTGSPLARVNRN